MQSATQGEIGMNEREEQTWASKYLPKKKFAFCSIDGLQLRSVGVRL